MDGPAGPDQLVSLYAHTIIDMLHLAFKNNGYLYKVIKVDTHKHWA